MNSPTCRSCAHFRQHYVLDKQSCTAINCGHCVFPRIKHRSPYAPACSNYLPNEESNQLPNQGAVIRYLTTEMLEYILKLELPPEITPLPPSEKITPENSNSGLTF